MSRKAKVPKRPIGRPTLYSDAMLDIAYDYSKNYDKPRYGSELIPSHNSLCTHLSISRNTLNSWIKEENREELLTILSLIEQIAENNLIQNGLSSSFNSSITKLVLASKHGYLDTQQAQMYNPANTQPISITFVNASTNPLINPAGITIEQGKDALEHQIDDTLAHSIG